MDGVADRSKMGTKDMIAAMAVVLVVVVLIALYASNMSFAPGARVDDGPVPTADVVPGFAHAAETMPFPVLVPTGLPEDWHPNSFSVSTPQVDGIGTPPTVRGGWITPAGAFITLIESSADAAALLSAELDASGSHQGTVEAGGAEWTLTTGVRTEAAWVRTAGETTVLITGNAAEADFLLLADALR